MQGAAKSEYRIAGWTWGEEPYHVRRGGLVDHDADGHVPDLAVPEREVGDARAGDEHPGSSVPRRWAAGA